MGNIQYRRLKFECSREAKFLRNLGRSEELTHYRRSLGIRIEDSMIGLSTAVG